jgi:NAD(P)-dependent dehydrogenase (short-subunit alcohol dehydrogenase family)
MSNAVIFGGYGTFGVHVARELVRLGMAVRIAGRDLGRAEAFARTLGPGHDAWAADLTQAASFQAALQGQTMAINCAGPFHDFQTTLLDACLQAGCHYADITDDRGYTQLVRSYDARFRQRGLAAVYGCSSLPAISGALGLVAGAGSPAVPARARVTLMIGNNNPKGQAAVRSLVRSLGKRIAAPQGVIQGFRDREVVTLPAPFGRRAVFNFESPEYDLFPELLGVPSVSVKVGFEFRPATYACALLALLGSTYGPGTADLLEHLGRPFRWLGSSGGAVMTELFFPDGSSRRAALVAPQEGQRMVALPCALAAHALGQGANPRPGAQTAYELLGAGPLLDGLVAAGFELHR